MIYQDNPRLPDYIQHYGCLVCVLARSREVIREAIWSAKELREAWEIAEDAGIISGDLNHDGDRNDDGEAEVLNYQGLFDLWNLPLRQHDIGWYGLPTMIDRNGAKRIAPSALPLDQNKLWVAERWVWKIGHFVQGDGTGKHFPYYDPISGGSLTRKNGAIESLRVFEIVR